MRNLKPATHQDILLERARLLARLPEETRDETDWITVAAFRLGQERYGIEIGLLREVQPLTPHTWTPVPCTPDFVTGVVNVRGHVYSVIDIARYLGLPLRPLPNTAHIILVEGFCSLPEGADTGSLEMVMGLLADDLPVMVRVSRAELHPPASLVTPRALPYVRGVTSDRLILLNLEQLLSDPGIIVDDSIA